MSKEAMKLALITEAAIQSKDHPSKDARTFAKSVHEYLMAEQPAPATELREQEPVAWLIWLHGPAGHFDHKQFAELEFDRRNKEYPDPDRKLLPLYTSPPAQRTWVGLTDEEIVQIELGLRQYNNRDTYDLSLKDFARAIEAKLKEKNT